MARQMIQPQSARVMNTYTRLPLEAINTGLRRREAAYDVGRQQSAALKKALNFKVLSADETDKEKRVQAYNDKINQAVKDIGGDYGKFDDAAFDIGTELEADLTTGDLASLRSNYTAAMEYLKEMEKENDWGADQTSSFASYQIGRFKTFDEEGKARTFSGRQLGNKYDTDKWFANQLKDIAPKYSNIDFRKVGSLSAFNDLFVSGKIEETTYNDIFRTLMTSAQSNPDLVNSLNTQGMLQGIHSGDYEGVKTGKYSWGSNLMTTDKNGETVVNTANPFVGQIMAKAEAGQYRKADLSYHQVKDNFNMALAKKRAELALEAEQANVYVGYTEEAKVQKPFNFQQDMGNYKNYKEQADALAISFFTEYPQFKDMSVEEITALAQRHIDMQIDPNSREGQMFQNVSPSVVKQMAVNVSSAKNAASISYNRLKVFAEDYANQSGFNGSADAFLSLFEMRSSESAIYDLGKNWLSKPSNKDMEEMTINMAKDLATKNKMPFETALGLTKKYLANEDKFENFSEAYDEYNEKNVPATAVKFSNQFELYDSQGQRDYKREDALRKQFKEEFKSLQRVFGKFPIYSTNEKGDIVPLEYNQFVEQAGIEDFKSVELGQLMRSHNKMPIPTVNSNGEKVYAISWNDKSTTGKAGTFYIPASAVNTTFNINGSHIQDVDEVLSDYEMGIKADRFVEVPHFKPVPSVSGFNNKFSGYKVQYNPATQKVRWVDSKGSVSDYTKDDFKRMMSNALEAGYFSYNGVIYNNFPVEKSKGYLTDNK